jgi:hypothetical protein
LELEPEGKGKLEGSMNDWAFWTRDESWNMARQTIVLSLDNRSARIGCSEQALKWIS